MKKGELKEEGGTEMKEGVGGRTKGRGRARCGISVKE